MRICQHCQREWKDYYGIYGEFCPCRLKPLKPIDLSTGKKKKIKITIPVINKRLKKLMELYNSKCFYCGLEVIIADNRRNIPAQATVDHYIPKSKGGTGHIENLRLSCRKCNFDKADKMPTDI